MGTRPNPLRRLTGTPKANRVHTLALTALLQEQLVTDPRVIAVFEQFELGDLARELGRYFEDVARGASLAGRADLLVPGAQLPAEGQTALDTYRRLEREAIPTLTARLQALVFDTWQLPWPGLVHELAAHYLRLLNSLITGAGWAGTFTPPHAAPPARDPGESRAAYLARLARFYPSERDRQGVQLNEARIRRDVRIFYRLHLKHPPDRIGVVTRDEGMKSDSNTKRAAARARQALTDAVPRRSRRPPEGEG